MRRFAERYTLRTFNGRPLMLETLLEAYREYAGARRDAQALHRHR